MAGFGGGGRRNHPVHSFPHALVYSRDTALFLGLQGGSEHPTGAGWSWAFTELNTLLLCRATVHVYGAWDLTWFFWVPGAVKHPVYMVLAPPCYVMVRLYRISHEIIKPGILLLYSLRVTHKAGVQLPRA